MRIRFEKKTYKQAVVNVTILALILGLFVYLGVQFSQNFSNAVSTQRTQIVTDTDYSYLGGYVFRNETPISMSESGVCDFLFEDGARIGVDEKYGVFYPFSGDSKAKQGTLNYVSERIRRLNSKISADGYVSELPSVEERLKNSYYAYIDSVLDGNFASADAGGEGLLGAMVDRNVITGREGEVEDLTAILEKQKSDIIDSLGSSGRSLVSDDGFYLSYYTDGYEELFTSASLDNMTPEEFRSLSAASPKTYGDRVIGRTILSPEWFLALDISFDEAQSFFDGEGNVKAGERYEVTFTNEGEATVVMTLEDVRLDEDGKGFIIFSSFDLSVSYGFSRAQDVKVKLSSVTGYRIPSDSLEEHKGESGVYILVGTVVEFRRVTVIGEGNGYFIVETYEADAARREGDEDSDNAAEYPYLNVNDLIITSGNDLFDGKLID